ncbi:hypothetical protein LOD99_16246 [Oopsacas minuta]|uniref:Uncharacterized protein n=1 Tax=Oopsacas minuta TaxID=111878 RepID=A0AAV7K8R5_9METZ|nr:hypothetical protein LOD99_16246 [Oopsacas minuta]
MADQKISSSRSDKEDFGTMANNVRTKIQTYFSQLIEVIKLRRTKLISELDEIIYRKRQEEKKINELEKINIFPCEMYSSSIVKDVQDDVISRIGPQLANLRKNHSLILEFEWNQKFAREASGLGKLKTNDYLSPSSSLSSNILPVSDNLHNSNASNSNSSNDNIPTSHVKSNSYHSSLNQSKIASNSKPNGNKISVTLFQSDFPKELQELITLRTDIGIIPRDCLELKTFTSKFSHYPNWSADIKGCYNCGTFTLNELNNKYFCRLRCYLIFYEWCRVKVQSVLNTILSISWMS